ncbi:MAG: ornithine cyclodeaminase family protein [Chitinophagaceae bacterium]
MIVLTNEEISSLLSFKEIIEAVESAMVSYEGNSCIVPKRMHIDHGNNTLLCMPAFNDSFFATKLVSVVPGNKSKKLPVTIGALLLNDTVTGLPLALMNAEKLTALRTGAVGAIGIKYTTPAAIDSVGLIGCGIQGVHQAIFACSVRNIKQIFAFDNVQTCVGKLVAIVNKHHPTVHVVPCSSAKEVLDKTTVIITATTSSGAILPNDTSLLEGKHFIGIGSYKPTMQELPDHVFSLAKQLVIDSEFARRETGDIINPIQKGLLKDEDVFTIGKLITGERTININETTVYKSAGMALYDLFAAEAMYKKAVEENIGTTIDF